MPQPRRFKTRLLPLSLGHARRNPPPPPLHCELLRRQGRMRHAVPELQQDEKSGVGQRNPALCLLRGAESSRRCARATPIVCCVKGHLHCLERQDSCPESQAALPSDPATSFSAAWHQRTIQISMVGYSESPDDARYFGAVFYVLAFKLHTRGYDPAKIGAPFVDMMIETAS